MTLKLRLPLVALVVVMGACESAPTSPTLPATFTLKPGESTTIGATRVAFVGVASDSRCPIDVQCFHAGDAVARFVVGSREHPLTLIDPAGKTLDHQGIVIEFTRLEPLPVGIHRTAPEDYRATVTVRSR